MTRVLKNYLSGQWVEGEGAERPLHNPVTEEVLAVSKTGGLDLAAALDFARNQGGNALREMNFKERGDMLNAMAKVLHEHREEFLDLAALNGGNTRGDAKFDVDGASFTLGFYGRHAQKLGESQILLDEEQLRLARSPRFVGQHIYTSRRGVAVHINAFNFPAWGFAEKAAAALLAGMPVLCKPATATALVTERMFEVLASSGVVPEGAVSMLAGSAGDLLDHLQWQDVLAFTGSSGTATMLRTHENIVAQNVRVNVEADSLNAAILGPDVDVETDTFDLFLREVTRDMTQKAGQKCTAIRRVFVPADRMEEVRGELIAQLEGMPAGNPALREVKVGPLATASQRDEVMGGVQRLLGCTRAVFGDGTRGNLVDIDNDKGYFVSPTLLEASDLNAPAVHADEVFGPVATLLPYSGKPAEVADAVQLGQGGLVSSVYSDDKKFVGGVLTGIAPYNGRLHLGSAKMADESPGPGTTMPPLVHGGPGRAGGGEELGGTRSMHFYMQRTAIQGDKVMLDRILGSGQSE